MTKPAANPLPILVQGFFAQHLIAERQLSPCTVASYRDTLRLLLAVAMQKKPQMDTDKHRFCRPNLKDSRPPSSHCLVTGFSTGKTQACLSPSVFICVHLWLKSFPTAWIRLSWASIAQCHRGPQFAPFKQRLSTNQQGLGLVAPPPLRVFGLR